MGNFNRRTDEKSSSSGDRTPQSERKLMVAAARLDLLELATTSAQAVGNCQYFPELAESGLGLLKALGPRFSSRGGFME